MAWSCCFNCEEVISREAFVCPRCSQPNPIGPEGFFGGRPGDKIFERLRQAEKQAEKDAQMDQWMGLLRNGFSQGTEASPAQQAPVNVNEASDAGNAALQQQVKTLQERNSFLEAFLEADNEISNAGIEVLERDLEKTKRGLTELREQQTRLEKISHLFALYPPFAQHDNHAWLMRVHNVTLGPTRTLGLLHALMVEDFECSVWDAYAEPGELNQVDYLGARAQAASLLCVEELEGWNIDFVGGGSNWLASDDGELDFMSPQFSSTQCMLDMIRTLLPKIPAEVTQELSVPFGSCDYMEQFVSLADEYPALKRVLSTSQAYHAMLERLAFARGRRFAQFEAMTVGKPGVFKPSTENAIICDYVVTLGEALGLELGALRNALRYAALLAFCSYVDEPQKRMAFMTCTSDFADSQDYPVLAMATFAEYAGNHQYAFNLLNERRGRFMPVHGDEMYEEHVSAMSEVMFEDYTDALEKSVPPDETIRRIFGAMEDVSLSLASIAGETVRRPQ